MALLGCPFTTHLGLLRPGRTGLEEPGGTMSVRQAGGCCPLPSPCPSGVCTGCAFILARMVMVRAEHPSHAGPGPLLRLWPRVRCHHPKGTQGQALPGAAGTHPEQPWARLCLRWLWAPSKLRLHGGTGQAPTSAWAPAQAPGLVGAAPGPLGAERETGAQAPLWTKGQLGHSSAFAEQEKYLVFV